MNQDLSAEVNPGGDTEQLLAEMEAIGLNNKYKAQRFKKVLEAKKAIIITQKDYEDGKMVSSTQEIEMVDDAAVQVQALKLWVDVAGNKREQKAGNNIKNFIGKVFVVQKPGQSPSQEADHISVTTEDR